MKYHKFLSLFTFSITLPIVALYCQINFDNENFSINHDDSKYVWDDDPITNFAINANALHDEIIDKWMLDANNTAILNDIGASMWGNETKINGFYQNKLEMSFGKKARIFDGSNKGDKYISSIGDYKQGSNNILNYDVSKNNEKAWIDTYIKEVSQLPSGNGWNSGRKPDSPNVFEDPFWYIDPLASKIQNWNDYWMNYIKLDKKDASEKISEVNISLFKELLTNMLSSESSKSLNGFKGYYSPNGSENTFNHNNFINKLEHNPEILPITNSASYRCGLNYGLAIHFLELIKNINIKAISYSLDNLISIIDSGVSKDSENKLSYYVSLGLNDTYFSSVEAVKRNENILIKYLSDIENEDISNEWIPQTYCESQANWKELKKIALQYISTKIIDEQDLKYESNYDEINNVIDYTNIDDVKNRIYNWVKNHQSVPSNDQIDTILSDHELKNNEWYKNAKTFNIYNSSLYDFLILVLPSLNYSTNLYIGNNSQDPTIFSKIDNTNDNIDGADGIFTFSELVNGHSIFLGFNSSNRSFKTNIFVDDRLQKQNDVQIDKFLNDINITSYKKDKNLSGENTIKLTQLANDSYYTINEETIKIANLTKSQNFAIIDDFKKMSASNAFESMSSKMYYERLKQMFYISSTKQLVPPFLIIDSYDNVIQQITNSFLNVYFNDSAGRIYVELIDNNSEIVETITCDGFNKTAKPELISDFESFYLGMTQPKFISDKKYTITCNNFPKDSIWEIVVENRNIVNALNIETYENNVSFSLLPITTGKAYIRAILKSSKSNLIYCAKDFQTRIDDIFNPDKNSKPQIYNKSWKNDLNVFVNEQNTYTFDIKNFIPGTKFEIFASDPSIDITIIDKERCSFQIFCDSLNLISPEINIKLYDENFNDIVYENQSFKLEILTRSNSGMSTEQILLIIGITAFGLVLLIIAWYTLKSKLNKKKSIEQV